jgi:hypothetical protein
MIVVSAVLAAAMALETRSWGHRGREAVAHPPGCHACSMCRPEVAAARDAFLISTGSIAAPDDLE